MTMIRINLIAERKTGAPKAVKKPTGRESELKDNFILIIGALAAVLVFMGLRHIANKEDRTVAAEKVRLESEWEKVKIWKEKKREYEIQKELLNEKIQKISELKDRREGPVKLMEDIANVVPDSVWLGSIRQGYDKDLLKPSAKNRKVQKMPGKAAGKPYEIIVSGYANSAEAITNFANKILTMDSRYKKSSLNDYSQKGNGPQEYAFNIYFEIKKKGSLTDTDVDAEGGEP
jgi:Tfp pilus assembly protein PilN